MFRLPDVKIAWINPCPETGLFLQNLVWGILAGSKCRPISSYKNIEKDFLQIQIRETERDSQILWHCTREKNLKKKRFEYYKQGKTKIIELAENDRYADNLVMEKGWVNLDEVKKIKEKSIELFMKVEFQVV